MTSFLISGGGRARYFKPHSKDCAQCGASFVTDTAVRIHCSDECRFFSKAIVGEADECWPWKGAIHNKLGHGSFSFNGRARVASRFALQIQLGRELRPGEYACHKCDNPPCVNPAHLFVGTHADNMRDMIQKGRSAGQKKTHCVHGHLLSPDNIYDYGHGRVCRKCAAENGRRHKARKLADNGLRIWKECGR